MARALLIAEKPSLMREVQAVYKTMNYPDQIDFKCFRGHTMTLYAPADYRWSCLYRHAAALPRGQG